MSVHSQILRALRRQATVSGAELAQQLGISRAAVWARIEELRQLGYGIEASPHHGYELRHSPDLLHADDLEARLGDNRLIGRDIRVFRETASTNDVIERLARDGAKEGVVVFAESQSKGRGRLGRKWVSSAGKGLWFSVLLRPPLMPQEATRLTVASATALVRAIERVTGLAPDIKWPNDLQLRGRKIAGVLTELNAEPDRVNHLILGIGLNVNQRAGDFPDDIIGLATSLAIEKGEPVSRPELATAILSELQTDYRRICDGRFDQVAEEWEARCRTIGQNVSIQLGARTLHGRAESLDAAGALLLRTQHGRLERVMGGDVTLEK